MANRINSNIKSINENDENYLKRLVAKVDFLHKYPEFNPDVEESKPFVAGFVNANNDIIKDEDTIYFGDSGRKSGPIIQKVEKRRSAESNITDYDYDKLKKEYEDSLQKAENKKDAAKYKEVKEDESPQEAVQTLVEFKAKNCTEEEKTGLGVAAIRCFLTESQQKHLNKDQKFYMAKKVLLIALIWIIVYILIAVPLWCQYGWCCCCCRCKFCHPRELIEEVKTFYENNPAGVYVDDSGNIKKYKPSTYEIYAEKNLKKAIDRL
ncbi:uncharacterized protein LOC126736147 [Anthonomus grandis grandis]|uniref:uncharacterized protein LOC126736147 n=1 Tax=Anthonomus grandis grandis TaxID=2921223 RepID=UPI002165022E|nr:uncharacterized protein LOC126736147 [Anthonomus grandis grandis]